MADDEPFLLSVYACTRADELALVPWSEDQKRAFVRMQFDAQRQHYQKFYPSGTEEIILSDTQPVGRLWVAHLADEIHVLDLTILPEFRNRGIGTSIIRALIGQGLKSDRPVNIQVETFNRSVRLFERMGFVVTDTQAMHALLKWSPPSEHSPSSSRTRIQN